MFNIKFRAPDYEDKEHDSCGRATEAVLEVGSIVIPLCNECIQELREDLAKYDNTVFCNRCKYWHQDKENGYRGTCEYRYLKKHQEFDLSEDEFGHVYTTDFIETCNHAVRMENITNR